MITSATTNIIIAIVLSALSVPLIYRKIPMNKWYGVRFPQSFRSEKNWYDINAYGGKILIVWMIPVLLFGIMGLIIKPDDAKIYQTLNPVVILVSVTLTCIQSYIKSREIDKKNA